VDSVDLSKTYLAWAEENMKLNLLPLAPGNCFIHADVKQWLKDIIPDYYDLVIMDPPTFSNSKRMEDFLDIQRDHPDLINQTLAGMKFGGILYFSTNFSKFKMEAEKIHSGMIRDITRATTPFDFQGKLHRYCFRIEKKQVPATGSNPG
jgi:23S rRNA (cytosine1962-C5)-methyltransferase